MNINRRMFSAMLAGTVAADMGYLFARAPAFETHADADRALVAITLDLYSHVLPNMQRQAAAAMGAALSG